MSNVIPALGIEQVREWLERLAETRVLTMPVADYQVGWNAGYNGALEDFTAELDRYELIHWTAAQVIRDVAP